MRQAALAHHAGSISIGSFALYIILEVGITDRNQLVDGPHSFLPMKPLDLQQVTAPVPIVDEMLMMPGELPGNRLLVIG
ncbi:MAG TPA: hypothetical protein DCS30_10180, partial [Rhizobiales bacterium]|nr:hypothetical protein [Hyphomicrobiales bacterium]